MANPSLIPIPADGYTLIATAIQTGEVDITDNRVEYRFAQVDTAQAAPTTLAEGTGFNGGFSIRSSNPIDVYVWAERAAGEVRLQP